MNSMATLFLAVGMMLLGVVVFAETTVLPRFILLIAAIFFAAISIAILVARSRRRISDLW